ncbi:unnamed protein product [Alternaria alternata]
MSTRPRITETFRTITPVRPSDLIPGSSTKAREDSGEAEDPGNEAEYFDNDQDSEDPYGVQAALGQFHHETLAQSPLLVPYGLPFIPENTSQDENPSLSYPDPSLVRHRSPNVSSKLDQKHIEATEEYSNVLKKLTISRDRTEASNFEEERLLAIVANLKTSAKTEITEQRPPQAYTGPQGNHSLQDYQMQLMLLEQQNKKKRMAKQESRNLALGPNMNFDPTLAPPGMPPQFYPQNMGPGPNGNPMMRPPSSHPNGGPQFNGQPMKQEQMQAPNMPFPGSSRPSKPPVTGLPLSMSSDMQQLPLYVNQNTHPIQSTETSAQIHGNAGESELISRLLRRIDDLERGVRTSEHPPVQNPSPPRFQILHVLDDMERTVCLQEPTWTFGKDVGLKLKAELPLMDLETYLRKNDDISFLVYKSYRTPRVSALELAESLETGVLPAPEPSEESIRIMSEELRMALQTFLRSACSIKEEQLSFFLHTLPAPYLFWYRGRSKRQTLLHQLPKQQAHLELLFDWIERNYATKFDQFHEMISRGRISQAFTEYLFFPGDVVVNKDGDKTKAYQLIEMPALRRTLRRSHYLQKFEKFSRTRSGANERPRVNEAWVWEVPCWTIVYDGQFYRRNENLTLKLVAESHDEEVDISELNVIPLEFVGTNLRAQLAQRGRTFWSCRVKRPISYNGGDEDISHTDGERYVIDNKSYKKLHLDGQKSKRDQDPASLGISNERKPLFVEETNNKEPPQAPDIYLFPPTIPGFSLRRKLWADLMVDKIVDIAWNKEAFKHLVADEKTKELVQALVADRISSERNTDIIQGKGNGLIILLHGGPGTGKTFTAESVAELAEKPLYPVTCGDIGTEPEQVERYLESVLYLGNLWDCVVLLDEADVFLEERGIADLARNALVSVFLRVLEYYDGILILTSNRVGTFDEAFKSRISLALHYPNFTKSQRCRIWKNFLNRLKALKEPDIDFDDIECNIQELASEELNGRQIRNAITIGRQLAKFQKKELSYAHLKHVVEVAGQFETYVKGTKENLSGEEIARAAGLR